MKRLIAIIAIFSVFMFNVGFNSLAYAQIEKIESEAAAKELAASAGGTYVEGSAAPTLTGTEIALPVIEEATGNILGYIVAEKESLISALNEAGFTEVADALAAIEAGTIAGVTVSEGLLGGTTGKVLLGLAAAIGIALAVGGGGGDDDDGGPTPTPGHP